MNLAMNWTWLTRSFGCSKIEIYVSIISASKAKKRTIYRQKICARGPEMLPKQLATSEASIDEEKPVGNMSSGNSIFLEWSMKIEFSGWIFKKGEQQKGKKKKSCHFALKETKNFRLSSEKFQIFLSWDRCISARSSIKRDRLGKAELLLGCRAPGKNSHNSLDSVSKDPKGS